MGSAVLEARGVSRTYGAGHAAVQVLKGLDFAVHAGEFIVLLGPSGSGKSTLLNLLGLMDSPNLGEVLFEARPTKGLAEEEKARLRGDKLGFVFQFDSLLPEFTVLENVVMPARIAQARGANGSLLSAEARALELLEGLGLKKLAARLPAQLSGGERQRAAICRALINKPLAVLADEPTGNLDKASGELVFNDLRALAESRGAAVVMVTHNEEACRLAHRVVRMQDGILTEEARTRP